MKERILQAGVELFWRYGIRSVTMSDVAAELGISKKTIYQHFSDKDAIVQEAVHQQMLCEKQQMEDIEREATDPIDEVLRISDHIRAMFSTMNPALLYDLKKYHPTAWKMFQAHKQDKLLEGISRNMQKGREQGLYRTDLNVEVLAKMRLEQVELGFDPTIFPPDRFNILEVQLQLVHHFLRGILTEKGFQLYYSYIRTNQSSIETNHS